MQSATVRKLIPASPSVECTYQLSCRLDPQKYADVFGRFQAARRQCLLWIQRRTQKELNRKLPLRSFDGDGFEIAYPGQLYGAVSAPDLDCWAGRMEHNDDRVPTRNWTADVALRRTGKDVLFITRLLCTTSASVPDPILPTTPGFVRALADCVGLQSSLAINGKPWFLRNESDLDAFQLALTDPLRSLPITLLTEAADKWAFKVDGFVLHPERLAENLLGCFVVAMPRELGYAWTSRVGKLWSAFGGSVRTFRPGIDLAKDNPFHHPLVQVPDIVSWEYNGVLSTETLRGENAFCEFLKEKAFQAASRTPLDGGVNLLYRYLKSHNLRAKSPTKMI
ncbi:MAG: hypothetical protein ACR2I2_14560 [Bryobacteraceae bacterium]